MTYTVSSGTLNSTIPIPYSKTISNISNGTVIGYLHWPLNASRGFVSVSWASWLACSAESHSVLTETNLWPHSEHWLMHALWRLKGADRCNFCELESYSMFIYTLCNYAHDITHGIRKKTAPPLTNQRLIIIS